MTKAIISTEFVTAQLAALNYINGLQDKTVTLPSEVVAVVGKKYVRLVRQYKIEGNVDDTYRGRSAYGSAYGFIDIETGNVLKAASWAAPAKGIRGNIYNQDTYRTAFTEFGVAYLR